MGMLHVLALFGAAVLCLVGALVLDRRHVRARLREPDTTGSGHAIGHVVGDAMEATLELTNEASVPVFGLELEPHSFHALELEGMPDVPRLSPGDTVESALTVTASRSGRWTLQGFDALVADPFGWVRTQDYLPCRRGFAFYPNAGRLATTERRRDDVPTTERQGGRHRTDEDTGLVIRELRDYQPGDPLKHIAWKATARTRRLISRDFEDEVSRSTMMVLDISGSMRGGDPRDEKLEHAIELVAGWADALIRDHNRVGLATFDEKIYGFLPSEASRAQYQRLLNHLTSLHTIVDPDLTEFDDHDLREMLADYLLVQDRLDFREDESGGETVDRDLLRRWITDRLDRERRECDHANLRAGVVDRDLSPEREFAQLRGLPVPYRVESRLGPKGRGLAQALERIVAETTDPHEIVVVTDLCGLTNLDVLEQSLGLIRQYEHRARFVVPFTPSYYDASRAHDEERHDILLELFTAAEREERLEGVEFLQRKGIPVDLIGAETVG
jgi:uncharacterized protein (DUF58 family)